MFPAFLKSFEGIILLDYDYSCLEIDPSELSLLVVGDSWSLELNEKWTIMDIAKLSFNLNFNLVESWDSIIITSTRPASRPASQQKKYTKEQL